MAKVIDYESAAAFVRKQLERGILTFGDIARLTAYYQLHEALYVDGKPGEITLAGVRRMPGPLHKVAPLPVLPDLRKPQITSSFKSSNPSRPNHDGCDWFYRWRPEDGPQKLGDGGATRDPDDPDQPRWFIPDGMCAIAMAAGVVSIAGYTATGFRVWIEHADGFRTGYFHLQDAQVDVGQVVQAGTKLGLVGDNPKDRDAKHLHTEVSPVDRYEPIDPEIWLVGSTYFVP